MGYIIKGLKIYGPTALILVKYPDVHGTCSGVLSVKCPNYPAHCDYLIEMHLLQPSFTQKRLHHDQFLAMGGRAFQQL